MSLAHRHLPQSLFPAAMGPPHTSNRDGTGSLRGAAARPFRPARLPAAPMAAGGPEAAQQQVSGDGGEEGGGAASEGSAGAWSGLDPSVFMTACDTESQCHMFVNIH